MKKFKFSIIIVILLTGFLSAEESNPKQEIGIVENLGEKIPLNINFYDEYGKGVSLGELMGDKPTLIALVYYRCPGICSPLLTGLAEGIDKVDLEPFKDYNIITVSFDHTEGYILANEKKKNYLAGLTREINPQGWRFLTSDSINIARLTEAIGWNFKRVDGDFLHGTGVTVISPDGKIVRYLYGTSFLPFDLKMAVTEATEGRVGTTIAKLMQICFSYDPGARTYMLDVTRISGVAILFTLAIFITIVVIRKKNKINNTFKQI
ncbi:MAG: SCO family protein [Ignavibacteriaceae bacterium]|nr:SCO family protein [Ignavibacteriaceae bacterium]